MGAVVPIVTSGALIGRLKLGGLQDRERLVVFAQNPANHYHFTKHVGEFTVAEARAAFGVEQSSFTQLLHASLVSSVLLGALKSAEAFMAGFETDPGQELDEQLATIRAAIKQAEQA